MRRMAGLWAALLLVLALTPVQAGAVELPIRAEAALLMEKETGQVLYAQNEHEALEPASITLRVSVITGRDEPLLKLRWVGEDAQREGFADEFKQALDKAVGGLVPLTIGTFNLGK